MAAKAKEIYKELSKDERISKEEKRLREIYKDIPADTIALYDGLIRRAAYMRVELEIYEKDMSEKGYTEDFSQSDKLQAYERGRPVVGFYNTMAKNYSAVLKQLAEKLPTGSGTDPSEELLKFAVGGKK